MKYEDFFAVMYSEIFIPPWWFLSVLLLLTCQGLGCTK